MKIFDLVFAAIAVAGLLWIYLDFRKVFKLTPGDKFLTGFREGLRGFVSRAIAGATLLFTFAVQIAGYFNIPTIQTALHDAIPAAVWPWLVVAALGLLEYSKRTTLSPSTPAAPPLPGG